ncbi:hypothetical protein M427DRAFT_154657 [Gonapodya prolifera JEL478]|uniref:Letm1 RBD domain-containing protein n=1 Tax=Gonapodya prolifera (strain JEL478) TaxID=1344416 RepID=A0A139AHN9_GONPJ|nr:hypothetical protein M427DRAFT_154657 [Gonapodya prolifera JEL478]|eukprot:KXS16341.1 hypothetical protein M427DRAFT_154657 [Gonapodya prolifera JEL478]
MSPPLRLVPSRTHIAPSLLHLSVSRWHPAAASPGYRHLSLLSRPRTRPSLVSTLRAIQTSAHSSDRPPSNPVLDMLRSFVAQPAWTIWRGLRLLATNAQAMFTIWIEIVSKRRPGKTYDREEILLVQRTRRDLLVAFPFLVYSLLPMTLPTIPLILRFAPGLVPTTFVTEDTWLGQNLHRDRRRVRAAKAVVAEITKAAERVLQARVDGSAVGARARPGGAATVTREEVYAARMWLQLVNSPPTSPIPPTTLLPLRPFLLTHFNVLAPPATSLPALCRFLDLPFESFLPSRLNRTRIARWADWVVRDDAMLVVQEGVGGTGREEGQGEGIADDEVVRSVGERGFTPILSLLESTSTSLSTITTITTSTPTPTLLPLSDSHRTSLLASLSSHVRLTKAYIAAHGSVYTPASSGSTSTSIKESTKYLTSKELGGWAACVVAGRAVEAARVVDVTSPTTGAEVQAVQE